MNAQRSAEEIRGFRIREGFARARGEASEVERIAGRVTADQCVEVRQVGERQIACAREQDVLSGCDGTGNIRRSAGNGQAA